MDFISRFGPAKCDLPTIISNIAFLLRINIVNIERKYCQRISIIVYAIQILSGACYFYVFLISMLWFVFIRCQETKDMVAASTVFSLGTCSYPGVTKLFFIGFHIDKIRNLIDEYLEFDASIDPSSRFYLNLHKALGNVKRRAVGFWIFITFNGLVYITSSSIQPEKYFFEQFGLGNPKYHTVTTVMMVAGVFYGNLAETNTSVFLIILTGYIEAQMLALTQELDNVWEDAYVFYRNAEDTNEGVINKRKIINEQVQKVLTDIAKKHIKIIHLLGQVESIFQKVMATEFGFLTLGLISELLGGLENTFVQLPYTLLQVAIDCFIGQRLIDASLALSNAFYTCKWERFDSFNQRTVYLMLMNSQKTLTLSVGGLTALSFSYLMSVLNSIYSAYTTLSTII